MTASGTALAPARKRFSTVKLGGLAGLGFGFGLLMQNLVLLGGSPLPGADLDEVVRFYSDNTTKVTLASGWVALNVPLVIIFVATIANRLRESARSAFWGQLAFGGVFLISGTFMLVTMLQSVLAARVDTLATNQAALGVVWDLHSAAFAINTLSLAVLLGSLSIGSLMHSIVPRWTAWMGIVGSVLLLAHTAVSVSVIKGDSIMIIGLVGFLMWVVWLVTASIQMLRSSES